jgi:hypothetical protein
MFPRIDDRGSLSILRFPGDPWASDIASAVSASGLALVRVGDGVVDKDQGDVLGPLIPSMTKFSPRSKCKATIGLHGLFVGGRPAP